MEDDPTAHVSFSLLYYSGIRFGEFLSLTPKDFDFEKNTLDITKSLQRVKKQDAVTPPKTPKSIRNIIIPDFARTRKSTDHLKHLLPPVSEQASGSGGYDTKPA